MIEGCGEWLDSGLNPPKVVTDQTSAYLGSQDVIAQWLTDRTVTSESNWVTTAKLFDDYLRWCQSNLERSCSQRRFTETLESKGFQQGSALQRHEGSLEFP